MQKSEYFTWSYHTVLFFCCNRCEIKFKTLFDYENQQQKRITNFAINICADIDYNSFMRIYRECRRKSYSFLTIDSTLPSSDLLRFKKKLLPSYKSDCSWSNQNFGQKNYAKMKCSIISNVFIVF